MTTLPKFPLTDRAIAASLVPFGVRVTTSQVNQVRIYTSLLIKWNQSLNLTSITDPHDIVTRHFGESALAAQYLGPLHGRLADVGSGAGFPGLALKIFRPDLDVTLIESNSRKCVFLKEITRSIGFSGVHVSRARVEDLANVTAMYDFVTARAFGHFNTLLVWTRHALSPGGEILLWLGAVDAERISSISGWDWRLPVQIPLSESRFLLIGRPTIL